MALARMVTRPLTPTFAPLRSALTPFFELGEGTGFFDRREGTGFFERGESTGGG